jgi:hypothetical protein
MNCYNDNTVKGAFSTKREKLGETYCGWENNIKNVYK